MINTWINNALKKLASFFTRVSLKQEQVSKTAVLLNASRLNVSKRSLYTSQVTSSTGIDLKHEATGITTQILGPFTIVTFKKQVRAAMNVLNVSRKESSYQLLYQLVIELLTWLHLALQSFTVIALNLENLNGLLHYNERGVVSMVTTELQIQPKQRFN